MENYKLTGHVGRGNFGSVELAVDVRTGDQVVVKQVGTYNQHAV
jgi:hypothetical protein